MNGKDIKIFRFMWMDLGEICDVLPGMNIKQAIDIQDEWL